MKQLFLKKLKNLNCLESTKFLLAISGGVDSMVLLDLFSKTNFKYAIAHCNFGLRDNESDIDADFVHSVAKEKKQKFFTKKFNTVKYAKEQNLVNVVEPIERSDYPDTEDEFYSIQNVIGKDMTINRAEAQMSAKTELALKIQTAVSAIARQQLSSLSDGDNAKQIQNAFDQRALSTSQLSIAKVMLIDSKLLRDRESQNYDYWVVYKVLLDDVVEVINQSDLGISVNSLDLFKNQ